MVDNDILVKYLVQVSKLALAGKKEDARLFIPRMARKLEKRDPEMFQELSKIAQNIHTRNSPLRNKNFDSIPIDKDSRSELLRQEYPVVLSESVVLNSKIQSEIESIVKEYENFELLRENNLEPSKTVIFTGPPGVGKTLTARLVAEKLGLPLLVLDLSIVMSSFLGRTGKNIKNVFEYAKGMQCVLLLDELDTIAKRRDDNGEVGELKRLVNVLLQEIDEWPSSSILIAATNHPSLLDPAVWRRFDRRVEFPRPSHDQVQNYLREKIKFSKSDKSLMDVLIDVSSGESFSDLSRLSNMILKEKLIFGTKLSELLLREIVKRIESQKLDKNTIIKIAVELKKKNVAERTISEITGLARETIRKHSLSQ